MIDTLKQEMMRELDLMARLRSPYIICLYGVVMTSMHTAIVMEFCSMGSLLSVLKKETLSMKLKLKIAEDCATGMNLLHENGIIHRGKETDQQPLLEFAEFSYFLLFTRSEARQSVGVFSERNSTSSCEAVRY